MTLGIDIGGTMINMGLVENGRIIKQISVPSFAADATMEQTLDYLVGQISSIKTENTVKIGIGVPSVVDTEAGIVYDAVNIPSWQEVHLKAFLEDKFNCPVSVNNDANCFTMGAYGVYPEDEKPEVLVGITLGTGVGIGIVDRGRLFSGASCGAGELGSLPVRGGILEDFCSKKFFEDAGTDSKPAALAAQSGDPDALALFDQLGENMGELVCTVLLAYDPSHIAIGGGIAYDYPYFRKAMDGYIRRKFPYRNTVERLRIKTFPGNDIPVIGASLI